MKKSNIRFLLAVIVLSSIFYLGGLVYPRVMWVYMLNGFMESFFSSDDFGFYLSSMVLAALTTMIIISVMDLTIRKRIKTESYKKVIVYSQITVLSISYLYTFVTFYNVMPSDLNRAIMSGDQTKIMREIVKSGDINTPDKTGLRPIEAAVMLYNNFDAAKLLIQQGANINLATRNGKALLVYAHEPVNNRLVNLFKVKINGENKKKIIELLLRS